MSRKPVDTVHPRGNGSRERGSAERRDSIVRAALAEFSERGFASARMEDIAKRAGVGKGTLYLYFSDKAALFSALVAQAIGPLVDEMVGHGPEPGESVGQYLQRVLPPVAARLAEPPSADVVRLLVGEGSRFPELAELYYREVVRRGLPRLRQLVAQARADGEITSGALERFPHLVIAPAIFGVVWTGLFRRFEPLDVAALARAQIGELFRSGAGQTGSEPTISMPNPDRPT